MSVSSQIDRVKNAISEAYTECDEKGATMPEVQNVENLAPCIKSIPNVGGDVVQEVMLITAEFSFATLKVTNISHTYNETLSAIMENKIVKIAVSYILPGTSSQNIAIGEVTAVIFSQNIVRFSLFITADLGTGEQLYQFEVDYKPSSTGTVIRLIQTGKM